jgi:hypothetical protein
VEGACGVKAVAEWTGWNVDGWETIGGGGGVG